MDKQSLIQSYTVGAIIALITLVTLASNQSPTPSPSTPIAQAVSLDLNQFQH